MMRAFGALCVACLLVGAAGASTVRFEDVRQAWNLDFVHHHCGSGERYAVETMIGGVVVFDYDRDGDDDVLLVDGGPLPGCQQTPQTRLFRNDLGREGPRFVDVTRRAGIGSLGYGVGGAAGDIDSDGDLDLFITTFGANALLRNDGRGAFVLERQEALGREEWSAAALFFDPDLDGDVDLYVANYTDFALDNHKFCGDRERQIRGYCHPDVFEGIDDELYLNDGSGGMRLATALWFPEMAAEAGLGVVSSDFDDDGRPDLYVANDLDPNMLFLQSEGRFEDQALLSGTAFNPVGRPEAGMGVEAADFDGDGRVDVYVTNFALETNALYGNQGFGTFTDLRYAARAAEPSLVPLGFGVAAADLELDGDLDLVIANGHILDNAEELGTEGEYEQRNQVMLNQGNGQFAEALGTGLDGVYVSRGLAVADFDRDGDVEIVVSNSNQRAELYSNVSDRVGAFLTLDLRQRPGRAGGVDALGARAVIERERGVLLRERRSSASYLSQSSMDLHFGGVAARETLQVTWPDGRRLRLVDVPTSKRLTVVRAAP